MDWLVLYICSRFTHRSEKRLSELAEVCDAQHVLKRLLCQTGCYSKVDIVLEGGLPVLIEMMHSADVETAHQGTGVMANLAEVVENQGKMVESGESQRQSRLHNKDIKYSER